MQFCTCDGPSMKNINGFAGNLFMYGPVSRTAGI